MRALDFHFKDEELAQMVESLGKNPKQPIDFNDFCNIMRDKMPDKYTRAEIEKTFKLFDDNGNGKVSFVELRKVVHDIGLDIKDTELQEMIEEADRNGDGLLDLEEFYNVMRKKLDDPSLDWNSDDE
eukprot:TRINITY_DN4624_c0_g1_i3.p2 TRINITY_DN4624_c0_g1~~TRINITY_DN4624_c0_g1_i3.p2  ORF type:complete len:127 (+),score=41.70 TRINITY_DN4624_c0_g1_i3:266-646(+)